MKDKKQIQVSTDENMVKHVASLARIELLPEEVAEYQHHLASVLDYVKEMEAVDVQGVDPLYSPMREFADHYKDAKNLRTDAPRPSLDVTDVLKNAPEVELNQFKVEAVIED